MIQLSLHFSFLYYLSRKYGLNHRKMRRRKRAVLLVFAALCGAILYGYTRGKEDTASPLGGREVNGLHRNFHVDRFDAPYDFINRNGIGDVEKGLKAREKLGAVEWANNRDKQSKVIAGNDAFMSDGDDVFRANRKKFPEPISLKPHVQPQPPPIKRVSQNQDRNQADIIRIQEQQNGGGAQEQANAAPPGFNPQQNGAAPPGVREDQQRLQKLQQELEKHQQEVQRQQALLRDQNQKMRDMHQEKQHQEEQWKKQQEEHQRQLEQMKQEHLKYQQEQHQAQQVLLQQQQQQQQQPQQPQQQGQQAFQPALPQQQQFQPQQQQFQPQQPQQFQPQPQQQQFQQQQVQQQQQPQVQPQPPAQQQFQPQPQPQQQQPQFQPNQQQAVLNNQQQQPDLNIVVQNNQGAPPMNQGGNQPGGGDDYLKNLLKDKIHLSVVCCGDRLEETTIMLKSAVVFTSTPMHFHIFAEDQIQQDMASKLNSWPAKFRRKFSFNIYPITFPPGEDPAEWKKVFKLCATQRLFLPDLLLNVDSVLYVDTDILFMRPLEKIWHFFKEFNSTQFAAMTPEHEIANIGWYNRFGRHPYYGLTGLNSGVMLMNLTRMRAFDWTGRIVPLYKEYKTKITWGDQDLINILFHFHPECVYVYPCEWNFRPDACMYSLNCHRITDNGVSIIHGNRGVYHNDKQLPFRAIYEAFRSYEFGTDLEAGLIQGIKQRFSNPNLMNMYCTKALYTPLLDTLHESTNLVNGQVNLS